MDEHVHHAKAQASEAIADGRRGQARLKRQCSGSGDFLVR
jgi:hypothetical protein